MSNYDPIYVRAATAYRAEQIRGEILGRHQRALSRRLTKSRKGSLPDGPWK